VRALALSDRAGQEAAGVFHDGSLTGWFLGQIASGVAQNVVGNITSVVAQTYSHEEEYAADAWSVRALLKAGRSPADCLGCTRDLVDQEHDIQPQAGTDSVVSSYVSSHPHPRKRLEELQRITQS
jgi:Zn-dependent protease with chaperone function